MDIICPYCGAELEADGVSPGDEVACPSCGVGFVAATVRARPSSRPPALPARPARTWGRRLHSCLLWAVALLIVPPMLSCIWYASREPEPGARPSPPTTTRPRPASTTTSTTRASSPAWERPTWEAGHYYDADGKRRARVVGRGEFGGGVAITGGGDTLVWTLEPALPMPTVREGVTWRYGVGVQRRGEEMRTIRQEEWIAQGGRLGLMLVDDQGETDLGRGVELARALLAEGEDCTVYLPTPTRSGGVEVVMLPLAGLRSALAELAPSLAHDKPHDTGAILPPEIPTKSPQIPTSSPSSNPAAGAQNPLP